MVESELKQHIDGCRKFDRQSQKLLYHKLYGFAMKICLRYSKNRNEASEILNDGFFKAFTNIEKYNPDWPFKAWLKKILYHTSVDYYRSHLKWSRMEKLESSHDIKFEVTIDQELDYEYLLGVIQQLPPAYRLVFNLYAIDGYSHEEIAEMIGISEGTSRSNLYKARLKLQKMLSKPHSAVLLLFWEFTKIPEARKKFHHIFRKS